jgi:cytoskeleton protein RodZ
MAELGELLRKTREEKRLSLEDAEAATKIRSTYLQALEQEQFDQLPGRIYVKGFLKNYARYLGLDAGQVLSLFQGPPTPGTQATFRPMLDEPLQPLGMRRFWPLLVAIAVVVLAVAGWWTYTRYFGGALPRMQPTLTPTATQAPPSPSPTRPPTATPTPTQTPPPTFTVTPVVGLEIGTEIVGQPSWIRVEVDGQEAFAGTLQVGTTRAWTARERIVLLAGRPDAVRVMLNGQSEGFLGPAGKIAEKEWTSPGIPTRTPSPSPSTAP